MVRHFLALDDAKTIHTKSFLRAQRCVTDCATARSIGVVHGVAGLGKTFTVEAAAAKAEISAEWFVFARRPSHTQLVKTLYQQLTGVEPHGELYKLQNDLRDVLAERPRMLVVDEAQQLTADAFELLRFLHDDPSSDFALILVGGNGCWKVISRYPMLLSRVYRVVAMRRLDEEEVLDVLPRYHTIHQSVSPEVLLMVDEQFARGNFRLWASFTRTVSELCASQQRESYDEPLALAALSLLPDQQIAA
jgi:DNA transposition AAA+ family ATPase